MSKPLWKRALLPLGLLVLAIVISLVLFNQRRPPAQQESPSSTLLVEVIDAYPQTIRYAVQSQGNVVPVNQTLLSARVSGTIASVSETFVVGGMVKKGDVLLVLESDDFVTDVKLAEAELARAEAALLEEIARGKVAETEWRSVKSGVPPELGLRKPQRAREEANVAAARANVERAQRNLERTLVRAPFNALITQKNVDVGQFINVGATLATLFSTDKAQIRLPLTDSDLPYLYDDITRNEVVLTTSSSSNRAEWKARFVRTEGVLDSGKRVLYAIAEIEDPYNLLQDRTVAPLRFGQFAIASIAGKETSNIFKLPRSALGSRNDILLMTSEQTLDIRSVVVERRTSEFLYISDGLNVGEKVVISPVPNPYKGMPVRTSSSYATSPLTSVEQGNE